MPNQRHSHNTLPKTPGELELCILKHVWQEQKLDAKQLTERVQRERSITLSTIQTTLERLVRKSLLTREKHGHAFVYSPGISRGEFMGNLMKDVIRLLHDGKAATILSSFVNVAAGMDENALDQLEALIRQQRLKESSRKTGK